MIAFIIFGKKSVTSTIDNGNFDCPNCPGTDYVHRRVRQYFSLYFIPLIPLGDPREYIQCSSCEVSYEPSVLHRKSDCAQQGFATKFDTGVKRVLVLMMLADGIVERSEIEIISRLYREMTNQSISEEEIRVETEKLKETGATVADEVRQLAPMLNYDAKERLLQGAVLVAVTNGNIDDNEQEMLEQLADILEVSPAHLSGIVDQMTDRATRLELHPAEKN